jgi:hypothetical protein
MDLHISFVAPSTILPVPPVSTTPPVIRTKIDREVLELPDDKIFGPRLRQEPAACAILAARGAAWFRRRGS